MRFDYAVCRTERGDWRRLKTNDVFWKNRADSPNQDFSTASDSCRIGSNSEMVLD
jgi:hypothetical protein